MRCTSALPCGGCLLQLQIAMHAAAHAFAARPHQVQRSGNRATMGILSAYVIYRHADIEEETSASLRGGLFEGFGKGVNAGRYYA